MVAIALLAPAFAAVALRLRVPAEQPPEITCRLVLLEPFPGELRRKKCDPATDEPMCQPPDQTSGEDFR